MRALRLEGEQLDGYGDRLERLLVETGAPMTAQWWWVSLWARTHPRWGVWAVAVETNGRLDAAAVLAERRRGPVLEMVPAGFGLSDYPWLPARSAAAADALAIAVAEQLRRRRGWRLVLNELPVDDPATDALASRLDNVDVVAGVGSPVIDLSPGFDPERDVSKSVRREIAKARHRLQRDGHRVRLSSIDAPDGVAGVLGRVEEIRRARDVAVRGTSNVDDSEDGAFWRAVLREAAERGLLDVTLVHVDEELAGYLCAFRDGGSYRVWDSRFDPRFSRYSIGHIVRNEALMRAVAGGFTVFDWMRGVEEYKLRTATRIVPAQRLRAWSSGALRRAEALARRVRG